MFPANPEKFNDELNRLRRPQDFPDDKRYPINWIIPLKKFTTEELEDDEAHSKFAISQAYNCMMGQIKLLQKLHSDRGMSNQYKNFDNEEIEIWKNEELKLAKGIVENFSIIEVVKEFPKFTKMNEEGKMIFDIENFKSMISKNPENKGDKCFIDEYELSRLKIDMEQSTKLSVDAGIKIKETNDKLKKECLKNEVSKIDILKDAIIIEPKETLEEWKDDKPELKPIVEIN